MATGIIAPVAPQLAVLITVISVVFLEELETGIPLPST
jgi:hypothetical protein